MMGSSNGALLSDSRTQDDEDLWEEMKSIHEPTMRLPQETNTIEEGTDSIENKDEQKKNLRAATIMGDWSRIESILKKDGDAINSSDGSTILHIAVGIGDNDIVKSLFSYINDDQVLKKRDSDGTTALHIAAIVGNKHAAELLVKKNKKLLQIRDGIGEEPLHTAYRYMHLDTIGYLLKAVNEGAKPEPSSSLPGSVKPGDEIGVDLLVNAIAAKRYSLALDLIKSFPEFASKSDDVLMAIAKTFPTGLDNWETLIYPSLDNILGLLGYALSLSVFLFVAPVFAVYEYAKGRAELDIMLGVLALTVPFMVALVIALICSLILAVCLGFVFLYYLWWKVAQILWRPIKHIENKKKEWEEAKRVLELVCDEINKLVYTGTHNPYYTRPILEAARQNAYKVVDEILYRSPEAIQSTDKNDYDIIQLAIINRSEKIYNLIYDIGERRNLYRTIVDSSKNNILHLAGRLAPSSVLNQRTGAALQLQRELQWREEVKKHVFPTYITQENESKDTPDMVFTKEHEKLVKEGEQWMKTTAESCSITAALITTIVFAAAITVPGGSNEQNGTPLFEKKAAFIIFGISDAISLFASSTALLVFLSILTARFAEKDFLVSLPRRLFIGLFSLLVSTTCMMIAFSATLFLVFCDEKPWMLAPICGLAFIPIASFVTLQFPLMVDLYKSTYLRIFGKQTESAIWSIYTVLLRFAGEERESAIRRFNPNDIRLLFGK